MNLPSALALGFFLGIRHATDADHLVAIGTLVRHEHGVRSAVRTGAFWGLGHTLTVLTVGASMVFFRLTVSGPWLRGAELAVAAMLISLGAYALWGEQRFDRASSGASGSTVPGWTVGRLRPLLVGIVHGLAGSAGVTLLALTTLPNRTGALAYLVLFGCGTVIGMTLLTLLLAWSLSWTRRLSASMQRTVVLAAGVTSIALGFMVGVEALTFLRLDGGFRAALPVGGSVPRNDRSRCVDACQARAIR